MIVRLCPLACPGDAIPASPPQRIPVPSGYNVKLFNDYILATLDVLEHTWVFDIYQNNVFYKCIRVTRTEFESGDLFRLYYEELYDAYGYSDDITYELAQTRGFYLDAITDTAVIPDNYNGMDYSLSYSKIMNQSGMDFIAVVFAERPNIPGIKTTDWDVNGFGGEKFPLPTVFIPVSSGMYNNVDIVKPSGRTKCFTNISEVVKKLTEENIDGKILAAYYLGCDVGGYYETSRPLYWLSYATIHCTLNDTPVVPWGRIAVIVPDARQSATDELTLALDRPRPISAYHVCFNGEEVGELDQARRTNEVVYNVSPYPFSESVTVGNRVYENKTPQTFTLVNDAYKQYLYQNQNQRIAGIATSAATGAIGLAVSSVTGNIPGVIATVASTASGIAAASARLADAENKPNSVIAGNDRRGTSYQRGVNGFCVRITNRNMSESPLILYNIGGQPTYSVSRMFDNMPDVYWLRGQHVIDPYYTVGATHYNNSFISKITEGNWFAKRYYINV